jgi:hypothetical protein
MDATEKHVSDHLAHRGYVDIVYEPDGNIPPDFLVDGTIAIEVRRLNKNYFDGSDVKGLEEVAIPLYKRINALVDSLGAPTEGESWFVAFRLRRPVKPWKSLDPKLRQALEEFKATPTKQKSTIVQTQRFKLNIFRASKIHTTMFVMGGYIDSDAGGWLLADMQTNIRFCATEKSKKIAKVRSKYRQWWLALVDRIGHSLSEPDREIFRRQISIEHDWDKIIIIDPQDHTRWFEI